VLFEGTGNVLQQSGSLFWDNTNARLGIGTATPTKALTVKANANDEGILLQSSTSGTLFQVTRDGASNNTAEMFLYAGGVIRFAIRSTSNFSYFNGGNFGIGTTTDAGFKLDVNGNTRVKGSGSTSATTALTVQNSAGTTALTVLNDGSFGTDNGIASLYGGRFVVASTFITSYYQSIGFYGATHASSIVEIQSTTKGFLPPRMTTTQKNAIASPAAGLVVYDTTLGKLCVRGAAAWETITSV
jgi:hypothetical protein